MSALTLYHATGERAGETLRDHAEISAQLAAIGVRFERWQCDQPLAADADSAAVVAAYRADVDRLTAEYAFQSHDVVSLRPDHPDRAAFRAKFLNEHTHADFEVRFFVGGRGLFYLHIDQQVLLLLCEAGDLVSVPAGTPHWFDMGSAPDFTCIRFFTIADGWVGDFTGSDIASRFPDFDQHVETL